MIGIAKTTDQERSDLFRIAASEMALEPAIVEKDFWVCYLLDYLFHRSGFKDSIIFKGGTSLSKAYGLIERFSEDVDLILDWRLIGYDTNEPWEERSNTKQDKFKLETIERTDAYLANTFSRPPGLCPHETRHGAAGGPAGEVVEHERRVQAAAPGGCDKLPRHARS